MTGRVPLALSGGAVCLEHIVAFVAKFGANLWSSIISSISHWSVGLT